jgi:hypothetical protein
VPLAWGAALHFWVDISDNVLSEKVKTSHICFIFFFHRIPTVPTVSSVVPDPTPQAYSSEILHCDQ